MTDSAPLYFQEYKEMQQHGDMTYRFEIRNDMVTRYAWAIPNEEALSCIAKYAPIIEMGAGTGYWAAELESRGVEIVAFDSAPPLLGFEHGNPYWMDANKRSLGLRSLWSNVHRGSVEMLHHFPDFTLFLCWPPYGERMASKMLNAYKGNTLIYVGEGNGGCTGDDRFHEKLEEEWEEIEEVSIPQWYGIHDYLTVYKRL